MDSDDEWDKDKLKKQVEFHKSNPDILMSYTGELWIRDNNVVKVPKKFQKHGGDIFDRCLSHCIIAPSSVLISKKILNQVENDGVVFDESLEVCEDYDLWLRIAYKHTIGLVDERLITKYAGHDDQLSFKYWGMDRFRVTALEKFFFEISNQVGNDTLLLKKELIKKYTLLLKGAIKYDRIQDIKIYEKRLKELLNEFN